MSIGYLFACLGNRGQVDQQAHWRFCPYPQSLALNFMVCHAALELFRELTKLNYLPFKQLIDCFVNSQSAHLVSAATLSSLECF